MSGFLHRQRQLLKKYAPLLNSYTSTRKFVALYDYPGREGEPQFSKGDVLIVYGQRRADGFYEAELAGQREFAPGNYLMEFKSEPVSSDYDLEGSTIGREVESEVRGSGCSGFGSGRNGGEVLGSTAMKQSLSSNLEELLISGDHSDFSIEVGETSFAVHKAILSARLAYFKRLFESDKNEDKSRRMKIADDDCKADDFARVLKFLYAGHLPADVEEKPENYLPTAEKLGIEDLKTVCCHSLSKKLRIGEADFFYVMIRAHLYNCGDLERQCIAEFVKCNGEFDANDLNELIPYPRLMLQCIKGLREKIVSSR